MEHVFFTSSNILGAKGKASREPIAGFLEGAQGDRHRLALLARLPHLQSHREEWERLSVGARTLETFHSWGNVTYYSIIHSTLRGGRCSNCSGRGMFDGEQLLAVDIRDKGVLWRIGRRMCVMDIFSSVHKFASTVSTWEICEWIFNIITTQRELSEREQHSAVQSRKIDLGHLAPVLWIRVVA